MSQDDSIKTRVLEFDPRARGGAPPRPMAPRGQGAISPFDAELARAGRPQGGVVDKISTENRLASQGAALDDVGAASSILGSLLGSVRSATPEALMRVHDLDGILYFYQV